MEISNIKNYLKHNTLFIIAWGFVFLGVLTIIIFAVRLPYNDWSYTPDTKLLSSYGDFIGGFVGSLFSLAGFILLYMTLTSQNKSSKQQDEMFAKERFENTFFNLISTQQNITNSVKGYFFRIDDKLNSHQRMYEGRDFFFFAKIELAKINCSIINDEYLGMHDNNDAAEIREEISYIYNPNNEFYTHPKDAELQEEKICRCAKIRYTNKVYGINKNQWDQINNVNNAKKTRYVYYFFYKRYNYAIGHYFRHLYNILKFIKDNEQAEKDNIGSKSTNDIEDKYMKYAQFIQAQMSSNELMLLYYNSLLFTDKQELLKDYKMFNNLALQDLIDASHCIDNIPLKPRKDFFRQD